MEMVWFDELVTKLWAIDSNSFVVVIAMSTVCAYFVKEALHNPMFSLACGPLFTFAGLAANAILLDLEWVPTTEKSLNTVIATALGIVVMFLILAVLVRSLGALHDVLTRKPAENDIREV